MKQKLIKFLCVEDSKHDQNIYKRHLSRDPKALYEFHFASNGAAGLKLIDQIHPDCILLDYRLPDMTGLEILKIIRGKKKLVSVPVIMVTGSADEELAIDALKAGAQDYLLKGDASSENLYRAIHGAIERVRMIREMQNAIQARDELLSITSHELKAPVSTLFLQIQHGLRILQKDSEEFQQKEKVIQILKSADRQFRSLNHLMDGLLDWAQIHSGRFELQLGKVNLGDLIIDVLERLHWQLDEEGLQISFVNNLKKNGHEQVCIGNWDQFRLEQVLVNLISNARKYGGKKPIQVYLDYFHDRKIARIAVRDQGLGISHEDQEKIFDRFERIKSYKEIKGLGLGLYIVKQIVEYHQGKIWVESELGKGSTFIIELPAETLSQESNTDVIPESDDHVEQS